MADPDEPDPDDDPSSTGDSSGDEDDVEDVSDWEWGGPGDEPDESGGSDGDADDAGGDESRSDESRSDESRSDESHGESGDDAVAPRDSPAGTEPFDPDSVDDPMSIDGPVGPEDSLTVPTDANPEIVPDEWWGEDEAGRRPPAASGKRATADGGGDDDESDDGDGSPDDGDAEAGDGDGEADDSADDGPSPGEAEERYRDENLNLSRGVGAPPPGEREKDPGTATGSREPADDEDADEAGDADDGGESDEGDRLDEGESGRDLASAEKTGSSSSVESFDGETAPDDEEMPLTEHVEEMALRFLAVGLVMVGIGGITLFYADDLINFLWYSFLGPGLNTCVQPDLSPKPTCPDQYRPKVYHPLSLVLARIKVATLVGFVGALPIAVYQTYRFMRPGLYPRERRYYLAAVPTSLVLAAAGITMAYFAVLPALFSYFIDYTEQAATLAFGLTETFNLIVLMMGFFALIFQIPLLVMLAIMMGVTTREWLQDRRLYFWAGFAAVAFVFSPDPTGMAPLIVAVTMIVLFDGTLLLLKWTREGSLIPSPEAAAEKRPFAWLVAGVAGYLASTAPAPTSYYGAFPAVLRDLFASFDLIGYVPFAVAGLLAGLYELATIFVGRSGRLRLRLKLMRGRRIAWVGAVIAGYFASPEPPLLAAAGDVNLDPAGAAAVAFGLIALYELVVVLLDRRAEE